MLIKPVRQLLKPPVVICGCHGSGTSYLVKLLRHNDFEAGKDSGDISSRKVHESKAFSRANEHDILQMSTLR